MTETDPANLNPNERHGPVPEKRYFLFLPEHLSLYQRHP